MHHSFGIARKLGLIVALFLLPVGYVLFALLATHSEVISFSQKERVGVAYIRALEPIQNSLAAAVVTGVLPDGGALAQQLGEAEVAFGATLDTATQAAATADRLRALGSTNDLPAARNALAELRARVGDESNLILDPDIDSFYVMDLMLEKVPDAIEGVADAADLDRAASSGAALSQEQQVALIVAYGHLDNVLSGLKASLASAYRGNGDGTLRASLAGPAGQATEAFSRYAEALRGGTADPAQATGALTQLAGYKQHLNDELDRLLLARIAGKRLVETTQLCVTGLLCLVILAAVMLFLNRGVIGPIRQLTRSMRELAEGVLDGIIPGTNRRDEVGAMAKATEVFQLAARANKKLEQEKRADQEMRQRRQVALEALTRDFQAATADQLRAVAAAATELQATAAELSNRADNSARLASEASSNAEAASRNADTVAGSASDLVRTGSEIGNQVARTRSTTEAAVKEAGRAQAMADELIGVVGSVGQIVAFIQEIANQTNLLALNATIEAARAGEAGKGFAVVAGEVKNLAMQTARATEDVQSKVEAVGSAGRRVAELVERVTTTITAIDDSSGAIAGAVDHQAGATIGINRNISEAASRSQQASHSIAGVQEATEFTKVASTQLLAAASELSAQAEGLRREMENFLNEMGKAGEEASAASVAALPHAAPTLRLAA